MTAEDLDRFEVGQALPEFVVRPILRADLMRYAEASGDGNPIHIDREFARRAGFSDVFAQGMLVMAHLARSLTVLVPLVRLRSYGVRFVGITPIHVELACTGTVQEKLEVAGEQRLRLALQVAARGDPKDIKLSGEAVIALS